MTQSGGGAASTTPSSLSAPRVAVVGAGIVGLAHAWAAAKRGCAVEVFERDPRAMGASVRNFGMIWPIGQSSGPNLHAALVSRALWLELAREGVLWRRECGSLHLAYRHDELDVLEEFVQLGAPLGYDVRLIASDEAASMSPAVRESELLGAMWSASELNVDPRQVIRDLSQWLSQRYGVKFHFGVSIDRITRGSVSTGDGQSWNADRAVVAAGADFRRLYPDLFATAGFKLCKLQMMKTVAQPKHWQLGPVIASSQTLRHYDSFKICSSADALASRIATETPELDDYGIHVMVSQNEAGELILGDSHEYGDDAPPYDKTLIDELILRELHKIVDFPDWSIAQRWHGVYAKIPGSAEYTHQPESGVHVIIASGGAGMTTSFGLADAHWSAWEPEASARIVARA